MLYPDHQTARLLADEHRDMLQRLARRPAGKATPERLFTMTMLGAPPVQMSRRRWLRWRRDTARRAAHAS
jgi:hypothetical protein